MIDVSFIVPTCNRTEDLRRCLHGLREQLPLVGGWEVVVTDDGTNSSTRAMVESEFPQFCWRKGPRSGPAANRNNGAKEAQGRWLIFVDDDCVPEQGFVQAYLRAIKRENSEKLIFFEGATVHQSPPPSLLWEAPHNPFGGLLISCNFGISQRTYKQVGRFDERYPFASFEDTEFAARFLAQGGVSKFLPDAKLVHPLRRRPSSLKHARMWEGRVIYALDQGATPTRVLFNLPWHVLRICQSKLQQQHGLRLQMHCFALLLAEWLCVVWLTPGWVWKWSRGQRSIFWRDHVAKHGPVPKYGF
jgi:GT2 family glycosyltransferase